MLRINELQEDSQPLTPAFTLADVLTNEALFTSKSQDFKDYVFQHLYAKKDTEHYDDFTLIRVGIKLNQHNKEFASLLTQLKDIINNVMIGGVNILYYAVLCNATASTELLIDLGADVNRVYDKEHSHSLYLAVQQGFVDMVDVLLKKGAKPDVMWNLRTALYKATEQKDKKIIHRLLAAGAIDAALPAYNDEQYINYFNNASLGDFVSKDNVYQFCTVLDPVRLYNFAHTNKTIYQIATSNELWIPHCETFSTYYHKPFSQFISQTKQKYLDSKKLTEQQMRDCILIRAHAYTIEDIQFDSDFFYKMDDEIYRDINNTNDEELKQHIFANAWQTLSTVETDSAQEKLLEIAVKLDRDDEVAIKLFEKIKWEHNGIIQLTETLEEQILKWAVDYNSVKSITLLLDDQVRIKRHQILFEFAAKQGYLTLLNLLLDHCDALGWDQSYTILRRAAAHGHLDMVKSLLLRYSQLDFEYRNAMLAALENGKTEIVSYLLEQGADCTIESRDGSPLAIAAENNHLAAIKVFITHCKKKNINIDINKLNEGIFNNTTPLVAAAKYGHAELCQYLIQQGADTNYMDGYGNLPIHAVFIRDYLSDEACLNVVQILCQHPIKFDLNCFSSGGHTPIALAARYPKTFAFLIQQPNIDINKFSHAEKSPLYIAYTENRVVYSEQTSEHVSTQKELFTFAGLHILETLLARGAKDTGLTLYQAAIEQNKTVIDLLVKHKTNPNLYCDGCTPLYRVCNDNRYYYRSDIYSAICTLIKIGANPTKGSLAGKKCSEVVYYAELKNLMLYLEQIDGDHLDEIVYVTPIFINDQATIKKTINDYLSNTQVSSKVKEQAEVFLHLLSKVDTPFAAAVILYAFLQQATQQHQGVFKTEGLKELTKCLFKAFGLQAQSKHVVKNSLHTLLFDSVSRNAKLFAQLNQLVINPITQRFTSTPASDDEREILALYVFEARVKNSYEMQLEKQVNHVQKCSI